MRIENELKLDFDDVLIRPKRSTLESRKDVDLYRSFAFKYNCWGMQCIPIIASNMDTVGTIEAAKIMDDNGMLTWLHKFNKIDEIYDQYINEDLSDFTAFPTIGEGEYDTTFLDGCYGVRIDVANGYRESFINFVKKVRDRHHNILIFAGNVCTPEVTEELILAGADVVVVGIGSGGQCSTRIKAGVGYPQLSAIIECADAAHGLRGHIASDGGCRTPADVVKAFAAGADFVVLGSMLAGHDENTLEENKVATGIKMYDDGRDAEVEYGGVKVYGMSSKEAMDKYYGGVDDHRTDEGICTTIPYRGPLENTIKDILGGLRSACTYVGAERLKELSKRTTFVRTNQIRNTHWEK